MFRFEWVWLIAISSCGGVIDTIQLTITVLLFPLKQPTPPPSTTTSSWIPITRHQLWYWQLVFSEVTCLIVLFYSSINLLTTIQKTDVQLFSKLIVHEELIWVSLNDRTINCSVLLPKPAPFVMWRVSYHSVYNLSSRLSCDLWDRDKRHSATVHLNWVKFNVNQNYLLLPSSIPIQIQFQSINVNNQNCLIYLFHEFVYWIGICLSICTHQMNT